jgi:uncharacterized membrane protein
LSSKLFKKMRLFLRGVPVVVGVSKLLGSFVSNRRAAVANAVVDIMVAVIIVGAMGASVFNFSATNFSQASSTVQVMLGTVVPMLAAIGIGLVFIRKRTSG